MPAHNLTTRDGKTIPLRAPNPLDVLAAWHALRAEPQDAPYIALAMLATMGAAPEMPGTIHARARAVSAYLAASIDLGDLVAKADAILYSAIESAGYLTPVTAQEAASVGESLTQTTSSLVGSSSADGGVSTPASG